MDARTRANNSRVDLHLIITLLRRRVLLGHVHAVALSPPPLCFLNRSFNAHLRLFLVDHLSKHRCTMADESKTSSLEEKCVNTVRILSADQVQAANSGHPGAPMGCAPMAHLLWGSVMNYDPSKPRWVCTRVCDRCGRSWAGRNVLSCVCHPRPTATDLCCPTATAAPCCTPCCILLATT